MMNRKAVSKGRQAGEYREVPIIPDMRKLPEQIRSERPDEPATTPVEQRRKLKCLVSPITTCAIYSPPAPLNPQLISRPFHAGLAKRIGALMRVYGHLRDQHSNTMAQKVTFSTTAENICGFNRLPSQLGESESLNNLAGNLSARALSLLRERSSARTFRQNRSNRICRASLNPIRPIRPKLLRLAPPHVWLVARNKAVHSLAACSPPGFLQKLLPPDSIQASLEPARNKGFIPRTLESTALAWRLLPLHPTPWIPCSDTSGPTLTAARRRCLETEPPDRPPTAQ